MEPEVINPEDVILFTTVSRPPGATKGVVRLELDMSDPALARDAIEVLIAALHDGLRRLDNGNLSEAQKSGQAIVADVVVNEDGTRSIVEAGGDPARHVGEIGFVGLDENEIKW